MVVSVVVGRLMMVDHHHWLQRRLYRLIDDRLGHNGVAVLHNLLAGSVRALPCLLTGECRLNVRKQPRLDARDVVEQSVLRAGERLDVFSP